MQKKKLVIFDFDGVIINTHDVAFALNQATNPHLTPELYIQMSHGNFYASFESEQPLLRFTPNPAFGDQYGVAILSLETPLPLKTAIQSLSDTHNLAIVSSAFDDSIKGFLKKENLSQYFKEVLGATVHKSKVVKLNQLLQAYDLHPTETVFITDTLGDIREANEVGIKSIGVLWGLHDRETLERGKPAVIIDDPALIEETIFSILHN